MPSNVRFLAVTDVRCWRWTDIGYLSDSKVR